MTMLLQYLNSALLQRLLTKGMPLSYPIQLRRRVTALEVPHPAYASNEVDMTSLENKRAYHQGSLLLPELLTVA